MMKPFLLFRELPPWKNDLKKLAACRFFSGLSAIGIAWETAVLVNGVFLAHMNFAEAAPRLAVLLFLFTLRNLLELPSAHIAGKLNARTKCSLRRLMHKLLLQRSPLSPSLSDSGSLLALHLETVNSIDDFFYGFLPRLVDFGVLVPCFLAGAFWADRQTALIFLLTLPIAPVLLYLIGRVTHTASEKQWQELERLSSRFAELLRGITTLKIFNRSLAQLGRLQKLSEDFADASLSVLQLAFVSAFALELITTLSIALISVSTGLRLLYGSLDFFTAFFLLLLAPEFYQPLRQGGTGFHAAIKALSAAERLQAFLTSEHTPPPEKYTARTAMPPAIVFEQVSYHYPERTALVLQSLSFCAKAGRLTVLAGSSGCGKSTILRLLLRLADPCQGQIRINDLPLAQIESVFWHTRTAYVPQEPHLFRAVLRENITLDFGAGQPPDDHRIVEALQAAALGDFLLSLPKGLDTPMGDGQMRLSFGQMRRLGLARAIWQNAPILLLDEITAGLDLAAEQQLLQSITALRGHRTILMAAHRPAALSIADTIIWLDGGKRKEDE